LYQLNAHSLNRSCAVICWNGGIGPHHENEFDAVLSVTGLPNTSGVILLLGWNLVGCDAMILV